MKVEITQKAQEELKKVLSSRKDEKPLRIYIVSYGWGGPSFGLALDEQKEGDIKVNSNGFDFVMDEDLVESFGSFKIDYSDNWIRKGFTVIPDRTLSSC